jgi:hypothetical protein
MALAPFFAKTALSAAAVLRHFDVDAFGRLLEAEQVAIAFDTRASGTHEGETTLELLVNLLSRLFPRLVLAADESSLRTRLESLARSINPSIEITSRPISQFLESTDVTVCVCIGNTAIRPARGTVIHAGSEGWSARLSDSKPVGCGDSRLPFAASAAACLAAGNVFRTVFRDQIQHADLDREVEWSLVQDISAIQATKKDLGEVDLGETFLVGLGAIGSATTWTLARMSDLVGDLHLIDPEIITDDNLQRYVIADWSTRSREKCGVAQDALRVHQVLRVHSHVMSWGNYLAERDNWHLARVAVAVDSARARCEIQASLPRWIANAWTQPSDLGLSCHRVSSTDACLACLYWPTQTVKNETQLVAEAIGFVGREIEVSAMLRSNLPVGDAVLQQIASSVGVPFEAIAPFTNKPLRAFYSEAVCGGIVFRLQANGACPPEFDVPMTFQSALAGVLLASAIILDATGTSPALNRKLVINVLRPLAAERIVPIAKDQARPCVCNDVDFVAKYRTEYGDS